MTDGPDIKQSEIDSLGAELNRRLDCGIRYCAAGYNKPIFECEHNIPFPLFAVKGAKDSGDWTHIIKRHKEAIK